MTEEEIVKGCVKKKHAYQRALFDRFSGRMMGLCMRYAKDRQEAQDFLQLGFIKIFDYIHQYNGTGSLEGWMRRVMISIATREIDKRKIDFDDIDTIADETSFEVPGAITKISEEEILQLILKLPDGYRIVFNLFVIEGYTHEEIAATLSIKESTSRSQLVKARKKLQEFIAKRYNNILI